MLAAAWLLPGLPLVLAGRFAALPMVLMFVPLAAVLCYFAVRQLPANWPSFRPQRPAPERPAFPEPPSPQRPVPWWAVAGTVAVAVVFAAWQIAERTEQIIFLRDPATYLQAGYWLARHGSLPIPDSLAAFGGSHPGLSFASVSYYPRGSGIVPQFMTGMPVVLAAACRGPAVRMRCRGPAPPPAALTLTAAMRSRAGPRTGPAMARVPPVTMTPVTGP